MPQDQICTQVTRPSGLHGWVRASGASLGAWRIEPEDLGHLMKMCEPHLVPLWRPVLAVLAELHGDGARDAR